MVMQKTGLIVEDVLGSFCGAITLIFFFFSGNVWVYGDLDQTQLEKNRSVSKRER